MSKLSVIMNISIFKPFVAETALCRWRHLKQTVVCFFTTYFGDSNDSTRKQYLKNIWVSIYHQCRLNTRVIFIFNVDTCTYCVLATHTCMQLSNNMKYIETLILESVQEGFNDTCDFVTYFSNFYWLFQAWGVQIQGEMVERRYWK